MYVNNLSFKERIWIAYQFKITHSGFMGFYRSFSLQGLQFFEELVLNIGTLVSAPFKGLQRGGKNEFTSTNSLEPN